MRRILIHMPIQKNSEYDIFSQPNNKAFVATIKNNHNGICPNIGNRLWFQGIISAIQAPGNTIEYFSYSMSKDYINHNFDMIVAPMANIFSAGYIRLLESLAERFHGIKIPVYVVACGLQAASYEQLPEIIRILKVPASKFISSVYETGGEFALRGYFTKAFFEALGFSSAVVTGCPSLYQLGRNLTVSNAKVARKDFLPLFNGHASNYTHLLMKAPAAVFMDQDVYWREILDPDFYRASDAACLRTLIRRYGLDVTKCLLEDQIKLIPNANVWREFIRKGNFSFSYGSRIHGNIMPILAGIPAVLECQDSRTREMAEFFDIPCAAARPATVDELFELYEKTDYTNFNQSFSGKFDAYEKFLQRCGIVDQINSENRFFFELEALPGLSTNCEKHAALSSLLTKGNLYWSTYAQLLSAKRKVVSAFK